MGVVGGGFGSSFQWHEHPNCIVTGVTDLRADRREQKFDQMTETHDFDNGFRQVHIWLRLVVERMGLGVVKPFTDSIQFLENVLHHSKITVHA